LEALEAAQQSVNNEEIAVKDMGSNEKTSLAWMEAWFDMYKALPEDNMAHITEGVVDDLDIIMVSKEGLPKAFVFSVTLSIRPTYPITSNGFWMPGNTGNSPGRDDTWGQMSHQVELRFGDDGKYHFVSMGTGGVGSLDTYDMVKDEGTADEESDTSTSAAERAQTVPTPCSTALYSPIYASGMTRLKSAACVEISSSRTMGRATGIKNPVHRTQTFRPDGYAVWAECSDLLIDNPPLKRGTDAFV
jgi:hypothetical protein